jgi:hypothetical protein
MHPIIKQQQLFIFNFIYLSFVIYINVILKMSKLAHQVAVIERYLKLPENKLCADCKRPSPTWASLNLGVFVCIKCSGCHREIGVHVTKIKSINLDLWPSNVVGLFGKISKLNMYI